MGLIKKKETKITRNVFFSCCLMVGWEGMESVKDSLDETTLLLCGGGERKGKGRRGRGKGRRRQERGGGGDSPEHLLRHLVTEV